MSEIIFSTLCVGDLYEKYTRFYIKKLQSIPDLEIDLCITSDHYFGDKIKPGKIRCHFNVLSEEIIKKTHKSDAAYNKTTCFKYFYKAHALKYAASNFPDKSICHTDCDIIPNSEFSISRFLRLDKSKTLYCPNTVSCSGGYGGPYEQDGKTLSIVPKLKCIIDQFIPEFNDYENTRFPIENILFFNKISQDILFKFCEDWLKMGSFSDSKGYPTYGDCFEIKPACLLNNIDVESTSLMPFCDMFKGKFIELLKQSKFENDEDFLNDLIKKNFR